MIPGMYPKIVNNMLSQNAPPIPTVRKTPTGGNKMAKTSRMILMKTDFLKVWLLLINIQVQTRNTIRR